MCQRKTSKGKKHVSKDETFASSCAKNIFCLAQLQDKASLQFVVCWVNRKAFRDGLVLWGY